MSDDRRDGSRPLSRRQVLSGLGAVGVVGALGAGGTLGLMADTESAGGRLQAGVLDLELCWEDDSQTCDPTSNNTAVVPIGVGQQGDSGSARIRYQLPDDIPNNPGYVWFRTACATDACGIEQALTVTLWEDTDCDGEQDSQETVLTSGSLCNVLTALHEGVLLHGPASTGDGGPLDPGDQRCLGIDWVLDDALCRADQVDVSFQFYAEQARHTDESVSPWAGSTCPVDCTDTSDCAPCEEGTGGISFVAMCGPDPIDESELTLTPTAFNTDREPIAFDWESTKRVERVVVKLGSGTVGATSGQFAMFEFDGPAFIDDVPGGGTRGHVRSGQGNLVPDGQPWNPCPDGVGLKYEIDGGVFERV